MAKKETQIKINAKAWKNLNVRKMIGESFSDVINRICLECPEVKNGKS